MERRLAAILAADVVGYSRLLGVDEAGTLTALHTLRKDIVEPTLKRHNGRVVKLMGDGLLAEFASVVDAVAAAVEIQEATPEHSANLADDRRIALRIGVNIGDVVIENGDLFGDGVNVAARLQEIADPDGVAISDGVHRELRGKLDLPFEDAGEQALKNIAEPVRTWLWSPTNTDSVRPGPTRSPKLPDRPSIVVLPFDNMSGDAEQEYFSDGITEDLITDLSKISSLFVTARNTAFSFKGQSLDAREVGRKLGVAHVLEGSVRKAGNRVRINAQLIETTTGGHVWAERYDGSLDDIFAVQDEITEKIVAALKIKLTVREAAIARRHITDNVEAYQLYLNGRAEYYKLDPEGTSKAVHLLEQAITIDPGFAAAYATLSGVLQHGWLFMFPGFKHALKRMLEVARHGVELDDTMGLTHARLGWALIFVQRYEEAISSFERAVEREPDAPETYIWFAEALNYAGNPARGLEMARRSIELDPVVPAGYLMIEGHSLYLLGDYDAAINRLNYSISLARGFPLSHLLLGIVYSELSRAAEAVAAFDVTCENLPPNTLEAVVLRLPYRDEEPKRRIRDALTRAGMLA